MNKKGMAIEQVFIFILAAVTFAVILIFGYKSISGFMDKGEEVSFVRFKTDLESSIKKISTEYGAVRIQQFNAPLNYDKICFIDTDYFFDKNKKIDDSIDKYNVGIINGDVEFLC